MSDNAPKDQEQRLAEAEVAKFKADLGPFVIAAEVTRMPMVFTDAHEADNPIIFANDAFLKLTGYARDEVLAQPFGFLLASPDNDGTLGQIESCFKAGCDDSPEIHYRRKNGSEFWATLLVNPVEDDDGVEVQHFISLHETTRFKVAQQNAAMLIDELNHRVKNTLATVQSIVAQATRGSPDPSLVRERIETRIAALSRSHDLLGREKWGGADLRDLVSEALAPFSVTDGRAERFTIDGDEVRLLPKATLALGIAFNELATNAVKYGAFSNNSGTIAISWTLNHESDGRWLCLHWREQGGPSVTPPTRKGFGSRVIEQGLAHELQGKIKLTYPPEGVVCTIHVPAPRALLDD
ncbi:MAG: PAS domain-containing protein [Sphingomonas bacterium]|nr:PAS domain-containing protein [Sphingomonas bacterium]